MCIFDDLNAFPRQETGPKAIGPPIPGTSSLHTYNTNGLRICDGVMMCYSRLFTLFHEFSISISPVHILPSAAMGSATQSADPPRRRSRPINQSIGPPRRQISAHSIKNGEADFRSAFGNLTRYPLLVSRLSA